MFHLINSGGSYYLDTLVSFNSTDGAAPEAKLIADGNGDLFGTTRDGGAYGYGTVFELPHGSNTITTLVTFNGFNGANPQSDLLLDSSGNLIGTCVAGGPSGDGTVFELPKGASTLLTLAAFSGADGSSPWHRKAGGLRPPPGRDA